MSQPTLRCTALQAPAEVIRIAGTLDVATAPALRAAVLKALASTPDVVVLDLSAMTVTDDTALSVFPALSRHAAAWPGTPLVLAAAGAELTGVLDRMAVCRYVLTYATVEEALADHATAVPAARVHAWLEPVPGSLALARSVVDRACRSWDLADLSEVAQLVVTEFVANGVKHAQTEMQLAIALWRRRLHIAVRDRDPAPARLIGPTSETAESGRGLMLVEALTSAWGSTPTDDGKVVWATLKLPAPAVR